MMLKLATIGLTCNYASISLHLESNINILSHQQLVNKVLYLVIQLKNKQHCKQNNTTQYNTVVIIFACLIRVNCLLFLYRNQFNRKKLCIIEKKNKLQTKFEKKHIIQVPAFNKRIIQLFKVHSHIMFSCTNPLSYDKQTNEYCVWLFGNLQ